MKRTQRYVDLWNDLGFSLYVILSVYYVVITLENRKKSEIGVSTNIVCCCWTPEIKFNKSLSSLIIRLANYSITTSFIFYFYFFFSFIFIFLYFTLDDEEACDTAVIWHVTWGDVISLEYGRRAWKMMAGTWVLWT